MLKENEKDRGIDSFIKWPWSDSLIRLKIENNLVNSSVISFERTIGITINTRVTYIGRKFGRA